MYHGDIGDLVNISRKGIFSGICITVALSCEYSTYIDKTKCRKHKFRVVLSDKSSQYSNIEYCYTFWGNVARDYYRFAVFPGDIFLISNFSYSQDKDSVSMSNGIVAIIDGDIVVDESTIFRCRNSSIFVVHPQVEPELHLSILSCFRHRKTLCILLAPLMHHGLFCEMLEVAYPAYFSIEGCFLDIISENEALICDSLEDEAILVFNPTFFNQFSVALSQRKKCQFSGIKLDNTYGGVMRFSMAPCFAFSTVSTSSNPCNINMDLIGSRFNLPLRNSSKKLSRLLTASSPRVSWESFKDLYVELQQSHSRVEERYIVPCYLSPPRLIDNNTPIETLDSLIDVEASRIFDQDTISHCLCTAFRDCFLTLRGSKDDIKTLIISSFPDSDSFTNISPDSCNYHGYIDFIPVYIHGNSWERILGAPSDVVALGAIGFHCTKINSVYFKAARVLESLLKSICDSELLHVVLSFEKVSDEPSSIVVVVEDIL